MFAVITASLLSLEAHAQNREPLSNEQLIKIVDQMRGLVVEQNNELKSAQNITAAALDAQSRAEASLKKAIKDVANVKIQANNLMKWGVEEEKQKYAALAQLADTERYLIEEKMEHKKTKSAYITLKLITSIIVGIAIGFALVQFAPLLGPYGFALPFVGGGLAAAIVYFLV